MRYSTAGMVTVTKLAVVNKSKGLFLLSDLSAPSQTQSVMEVIHDPCTHDKSPCRGPEFVWLSDLAALMTQQGPVVIYCTSCSSIADSGSLNKVTYSYLLPAFNMSDFVCPNSLDCSSV